MPTKSVFFKFRYGYGVLQPGASVYGITEDSSSQEYNTDDGGGGGGDDYVFQTRFFPFCICVRLRFLFFRPFLLTLYEL